MKASSRCLSGSKRGGLRSTTPALMRFDNEEPPNGQKLVKPKFAELPSTMKPVKLETKHVPFPLPVADMQTGFSAPSAVSGPMDYTTSPDALKAMERLQQQKRAPAATTTFADPEDLSSAMFFEEEAEIPPSAATDNTVDEVVSASQQGHSEVTAPPASSNRDSFGPTASEPGSKIRVHPWRPGAYGFDGSGERSPQVIEKMANNLTMPELVARWKACREYRIERRMVVSDFRHSLKNFTNAEIQEFLSVFTSSFDPGKNLELWQFQKQADARNSSNRESAPMFADPLLEEIYLMVDDVESTLVIDQGERLVSDPDTAASILRTVAHLKILDKVGNYTYDYRLPQSLHPAARAYSNVVHKINTGHKIFDFSVDLLESVWASEARSQWTLEQVVDLFANLVAAENPDYKPVPNSLLSFIPALVLEKVEEIEAEIQLVIGQEGSCKTQKHLLEARDRGITRFILSCSLLRQHGLSVLSSYDGRDHGPATTRLDNEGNIVFVEPSTPEHDKHYNKVLRQNMLINPSEKSAGTKLLAKAYHFADPSCELIVALSTQRPLQCKALVEMYKRLKKNWKFEQRNLQLTDNMSQDAATLLGSGSVGNTTLARQGDNGSLIAVEPATTNSEPDSSSPPSYLAPVNPLDYSDEAVAWSTREEMLVSEMQQISIEQEKLRKNPHLAMMDGLKLFPCEKSEKVIAASAESYPKNGIMDPIPVIHKHGLNMHLLRSIDFENLGPELVAEFKEKKRILPTYGTSLERVRSWDKAYIIHSSCCKKQIDQVLQVIRALENGKCGAVITMQTLLTIHQRATTSSEWLVRESNRHALRLIFDELSNSYYSSSASMNSPPNNKYQSIATGSADNSSSNLLLLPFSEEIEVAGNHGDWFDEDAICWILAQHLLDKVVSVAPVMLFDRLEASQEVFNCFRGDVNGNIDTDTRRLNNHNVLGPAADKERGDAAFLVTENRRMITSAALRNKVQILQFPTLSGPHFDSKREGDRFGRYQQHNSYNKGVAWRFALQKDQNYKDKQFELGVGGQLMQGKSRTISDDFEKHGVMGVAGNSHERISPAGATATVVEGAATSMGEQNMVWGAPVATQ